MKILTKGLILILFVSMFGGFSARVFAYSPTLSLGGYNGGANINITGALPNSQVQLSYTQPGSSLATTINNFGVTDFSGNFISNSSVSNFGIVSGAQIYATVGGQQTNILSYNSGSGYFGTGSGTNYGCAYYGTCSGSGLMLSQSNITLSVGQTATVTATYPAYSYNNNLYIASNTNSSVAGASVSGNTIYVNALNSGNTTFSICQNSGSQCSTLYVSVNGSNCGYNCSGTLSLNQTNLNLNVGQTASVMAYNAPTLYVFSNSNSNSVTATISGSQANFYGQNTGTSTIVLCATFNSNQCASVYVSVLGSVLGASNYSINMYDNNFSPSSLTIAAGASIVWTNYGSMAHTVTADDGSFNSGNINPGATFTRIFYTPGTYSYHCIFHGATGRVGMSGTIVVTASNYGSNLSLSQTSLTMSVGQTSTITAYNANGLYVSGNSNPGVASYTTSSNSVNITALSAGSTTLNVCTSYNNACASIYATVSGYNYGSGCGNFSCTGGVTLSQISLNAVVGQTSTVNIFGGVGYNYYVSGNSNSTVAGAAVSANVLYINGLSNGTTNITVCATTGNSTCAALYVTVGNGNVLGANIYSNGRLVSENGIIYIVYRNTKTAFADASVLTGLGFNNSSVTAISNSGLRDTGYIIRNVNAQHPWGAWVQSGSAIYFVHETGLIPVPDLNTFRLNGGLDNLLANANIFDFRLPILSAMAVNDYRLQ